MQQLPWLLALSLGVWVGVRALRAVLRKPPTRPRPRWRDDETATAVLDFVLVLPIFVMILLVVVQLALLINARLVVSYAAFTACRSAVVWLAEGRDVAEERALQAARIAVLPIAAATGGPGLPAASLRPLFSHGSQTDAVSRRARRASAKLAFAAVATTVELDGGESGPRAPVTVSVTHQYHLAVPYADGVFSLFGGRLGGLPVLPITDSWTLLNEGRIETP